MDASNSLFTQTPNIVKASLYAVFGFFCMAIFGVLTKVACTDGDYIWVSFIAYSTATLGISMFVLPRGLSLLKSKHYGYLVARAIIGTLASFLYMISMHYIPIVNSTLLFNTAPIFIPLLSVLVLKLPVSKNIWAAVVLGFVGIIIIIKPNTDILKDPGNLIGLASGVALAIAYLCMKRLTATEPGVRIIFYYLAIGALMQAPLLFFTQKSPMLMAVIYASLSGIALMISQFGLVKAYQHAAASQVGVYQYSSVVFVAIIEWLIWARSPGLLDFIGFVLVSLAGIYIIISSGKPKLTQSQ